MTLNTSQTYLIMKYCFIFLLLIIIVGCDSRSSKEKDIENIPINIQIVRFDKEFSEARVEDLAELKEKYPLFFPKQYADSIWEQRIKDTLQQQLYKEVSLVFPDELELEAQLEALFQHIKYYFPQFRTPIIYTIISDVDYRNKVILAEDILLIAVDTYLGENHRFYDGIQKYLRKNLKVSQLVPDIAAQYAGKFISKPQERSLLAQMIYFGKELYLKDLWIPDTSDPDKIGYTEDEFVWVKENEVEMWRYFIEEELLFSTNAKLMPRFVDPAPFSKFYLEIDNESPGMIGRYLGWQIVRSFMNHNPVSIQELLSLDGHEIFNKSKYKPKK